MKDDFDFGFSSVSSEEINLSEVKLNKVVEMIMPLLNNLEKDTKDYIYWPNRQEKIKEFKKKLYDIINS